jgi:hypothetical protein
MVPFATYNFFKLNYILVVKIKRNIFKVPGRLANKNASFSSEILTFNSWY